MDDADEQASPIRVRAIALVSCAPLAVLALWLAAIPDTHPWRAPTIDLLQSYAALLIAFCAGARIGIARMDGQNHAGRVLMLSALPVLAGWIALRFDQPWSFAVLGLSLAVRGAWDNFAAHRGDLPLWFGSTRVWMTFAAVVAMLLGFLVTAS